MKHRELHSMKALRSRILQRGGVVSVAVALSVSLSAGGAWAGGFTSPEECTAYTGDAHLNCLYAYIEIQKDKLTKFDDELRVQRGSLGQLRDQVDRQTSVTNDLQRQMSRPPVTAPPPAPAPLYAYPPVSYGYGYPYAYPPASGYFGYPRVGLGISIGSPYAYYGPGFYLYGGRRFFGGHRFSHRK